MAKQPSNFRFQEKSQGIGLHGSQHTLPGQGETVHFFLDLVDHTDFVIATQFPYNTVKASYGQENFICKHRPVGAVVCLIPEAQCMHHLLAFLQAAFKRFSYQ